MKLTITDPAGEWFRQEMHVEAGEAVRFFVRYGGHGTVQSGYSLGIEKEKPRNSGLHTVKEGITFFIEQEDLWYFDNKDLLVDYDANNEEILFKVE
jgi:uncharacterized protein YneR